ncbi:MAG: M20/M25/M40 family metallo-hydrolase [Rhodothermales bacterium]
MMLKKLASRALILSLAGLLSAGVLLAQDREAALQNLRVDVVYLASDLLEGRETGTPGEALAARYIVSRFEELGLAPGGADGGWFQPFDFLFNTNPHATPGEGEPRTGRNVLGFLDREADRTVVIGAHYDHLGYGGFGSRQPGDTLIHNGADDNASGVAALLEIARQLTQSEARQNNYLFIAFTGEELGLYGSKHFVKTPTRPLEQINYMINLDMVGRLGEERSLAVNGTGTSPAWDAALDAAGTDLAIKKHESGLGPSDHASFYLEEIPALHFFTGQHTDYHKPADDSPLINYEGIYDVASYAVDVIEALDGQDALAFTKTKDEDQSRRTSFKVSLGVMPDYMSDGEGVRIDAVMDGRPAAKAGLQKGDVVIRIGDVDVTDINAYMEALAQFEEGDVTTIVVKRGDKTIEKEIQF